MYTREESPFNNYEQLEQIGNGSFGFVYKGKNRDSNQLVAIKAMKKKISPSHQKEFKTMARLAPHPNIVELMEVFIDDQNACFFVMEYMNSGDLYQLLQTRKQAGQRFRLREIQSMMRQILEAFHHMHHVEGLFHRDIKPENLLVHYADEHQLIVKLADFGLATEIQSRVAEDDYVSTRWYRAPEVLLKSAEYSFPIDLWALGAIFAELVALRPLFPGQSEEDQLIRISQLLGHPDLSLRKRKSERRLHHHRSMPCLPEPVVTQSGLGGVWKEGALLAQKIGFEFPQVQPDPDALTYSLKPYSISDEAKDLLVRLLQYDPNRRITSTEALQHPFFSGNYAQSPLTTQTQSPIIQLPKIPLSPINLAPSVSSSSSCSLQKYSPIEINHVHTYFKASSSSPPPPSGSSIAFTRAASVPNFQFIQNEDEEIEEQDATLSIPLQNSPRLSLKNPFQRIHQWTKRYIYK